jgi:hypothetical protein
MEERIDEQGKGKSPRKKSLRFPQGCCKWFLLFRHLQATFQLTGPTLHRMLWRPSQWQIPLH